MLPAQAASGLRFLIKDDGSFEGSAINFMGERMGFNYRPIPSDVRLVAQTSEPTHAVAEAHAAIEQADNETIRAALDRHLAYTLKDPMSAMQYMAGNVTECRKVAIMPANQRDNWCICYSVNAKNSMGGFTGTQIGVASLMGARPSAVMIDIPRELINNPMGCGAMQERPSSLIHDAVH
jgi:hypothetical protein